MTNLNRFLTVTAGTVVICAMVAIIFRSFNPVYVLGLIGVPMVIFFLGKQKLLFQLVVVTFFSGLTVPGLPGGLYLTHVFALLYIGVAILAAALQKNNKNGNNVFSKVTLMFILLLAGIASVRGLGFRVLGDQNWGGQRYIEVFIMLLFLLNAKAVRLSEKEWNITLITALVFSSFPFLSELIFMISGGRIWQQYLIVNVNMATISSFMRDMTGNELVRFQSANRLGGFVMLLGVFFLLKRPRRLIVFITLYLLAFLLIGFSGHRSGLFDLLLFPWIAGMIYLKKHLFKYIALSSLGFLFLMGIVYSTASFLPLTFQRSVSWLPAIHVDDAAMRDAAGTMEWRLNLWDAALNELKDKPDYLFIGKGLTYSSDQYLALELSYQLNQHYMWGVITSTYHQGIISLLILTGIPGLILGTCFVLTGLQTNFPNQIENGNETIYTIVHLLIFSYVVLLVIKFYTVYGDLQVSWPQLCFWFSVLENFRYLDRN